MPSRPPNRDPRIPKLLWYTAGRRGPAPPLSKLSKPPARRPSHPDANPGDSARHSSSSETHSSPEGPPPRQAVQNSEKCPECAERESSPPHSSEDVRQAEEVPPVYKPHEPEMKQRYSWGCPMGTPARLDGVPGGEAPLDSRGYYRNGFDGSCGCEWCARGAVGAGGTWGWGWEGRRASPSPPPPPYCGCCM